MKPGDELGAALAQLRAEYRAAAPQRIAELWAACERVQTDGVSALEGLRLLVHRLAGSGGAYGLPAVSARAVATDQRCRALAGAGEPLTPGDLQQLREGIQGIAEAFHETTTPE